MGSTHEDQSGTSHELQKHAERIARAASAADKRIRKALDDFGRDLSKRPGEVPARVSWSLPAYDPEVEITIPRDWADQLRQTLELGAFKVATVNAELKKDLDRKADELRGFMGQDVDMEAADGGE